MLFFVSFFEILLAVFFGTELAHVARGIAFSPAFDARRGMNHLVVPFFVPACH